MIEFSPCSMRQRKNFEYKKEINHLRSILSGNSSLFDSEIEFLSFASCCALANWRQVCVCVCLAGRRKKKKKIGKFLSTHAHTQKAATPYTERETDRKQQTYPTNHLLLERHTHTQKRKMRKWVEPNLELDNRLWTLDTSTV